MTWLPNVTGAAIDLAEPRVDQVDFRAMAHSLANLNRYAGHGDIQVSVALHLLIGLDLCPEALRPFWLLHDGHEERLGEIASPTMAALRVLAEEVIPGGAKIFKATVEEFKRRHDAVIYAAAGLPEPGLEQRVRIAEIDERCLAIEHRDFHRASVRPWEHELNKVKAERSVRKFKHPGKIAEQLLACFEQYLPALRTGAPARLFEVA